MKKTNTPKIIASIIAIIALAVFIVNIDKIIPSKAQNTVEDTTTKQVATQISGGAVVDYGKCFNGYGESLNTIVFVHSNYCPHCSAMKPIVEELEKDGYKFYWAESSDVQANNIISNCFNDLLSGYVPQFICPKTGQQQTGSMSKEQLKEFADSCI